MDLINNILVITCCSVPIKAELQRKFKDELRISGKIKAIKLEVSISSAHGDGRVYACEFLISQKLFLIHHWSDCADIQFIYKPQLVGDCQHLLIIAARDQSVNFLS